MPTTWLVQTNVTDSPSPRQLAAACAATGNPFVPVSITPGGPLPQLPDVAPPVVFHGRTTLVQRAAQSHLKSGVFYDPATFSHRAYAAGLGPRYLNASAQTLTAAGVQTLRDTHFLKPTDDLKGFTGRTFTDTQRRQALADPSSELARHLAAGGMVLSAPPVEVDAEWRCFMLGTRVIAASMYRPSADARVPSDVLEFATACAQHWRPAPVFVLDVGRIDRQYRVIECGCFNWSRFYAADVTAIVRAVSSHQATIPKSSATPPPTSPLQPRHKTPAAPQAPPSTTPAPAPHPRDRG